MLNFNSHIKGRVVYALLIVLPFLVHSTIVIDDALMISCVSLSLIAMSSSLCPRIGMLRAAIFVRRFFCVGFGGSIFCFGCVTH